jgi:hypothetical protein
MALELKAKSNLWAFIRGIKEEHIAKEVEGIYPSRQYYQAT